MVQFFCTLLFKVQVNCTRRIVVGEKDIDESFLRDLFSNDEEFMEAFKDAFILQKLKHPTKFSVEVEDLEEKLFRLVSQKKSIAFKVLFSNYKRFLYKHIFELEKDKEKD